MLILNLGQRLRREFSLKIVLSNLSSGGNLYSGAESFIHFR